MGISGGFFGSEGDMKKSDYDPNKDGVIAFAETEADMKKAVYDTDGDGKADVYQLDAFQLTKKASADLRHTHTYDGNRAPDASAWLKVASFVITNGMKGTIRFLISLATSNGGVPAWAKIVVNGVDKGVAQSDNTVFAAYGVKTWDVDVGTLVAGDEIELHTKSNNNVHTVYAKLWKMEYENDIPIVLGVTEG